MKRPARIYLIYARSLWGSCGGYRRRCFTSSIEFGSVVMAAAAAGALSLSRQLYSLPYYHSIRSAASPASALLWIPCASFCSFFLVVRLYYYFLCTTQMYHRHHHHDSASSVSVSLSVSVCVLYTVAAEVDAEAPSPSSPSSPAHYQSIIIRHYLLWHTSLSPLLFLSLTTTKATFPSSSDSVAAAHLLLFSFWHVFWVRIRSASFIIIIFARNLSTATQNDVRCSCTRFWRTEGPVQICEIFFSYSLFLEWLVPYYHRVRRILSLLSATCLSLNLHVYLKGSVMISIIIIISLFRVVIITFFLGTLAAGAGHVDHTN